MTNDVLYNYYKDCKDFEKKHPDKKTWKGNVPYPRWLKKDD